MMVFVGISVIHRAFRRYGYIYLLRMMVMGDQIVPQEHRKTEGEENRYVPAYHHK